MRHRKAGVKLNRTTSHRQAMFKNMVTSLFKHDRIRTTDVKAKELRRWADHVITLAKRGDLHARRQVLAIIREKDVVAKIFEEAGKRFGSINGGYTRLIKIGRRPGDAAPVSMIEFVAAGETPQAKKKPKSKAKGKAAEPQTKAAEQDASEESQVVETKQSTEVPEETAEAPAQEDETLPADAQSAGDAKAVAEDAPETLVEKTDADPEEPKKE